MCVCVCVCVCVFGCVWLCLFVCLFVDVSAVCLQAMREAESSAARLKEDLEAQLTACKRQHEHDVSTAVSKAVSKAKEEWEDRLTGVCVFPYIPFPSRSILFIFFSYIPHFFPFSFPFICFI